MLPLPKPVASLCTRKLGTRKDMNARPSTTMCLGFDWFMNHAVDFAAFATFSSLAAAVSKPLQMCIRQTFCFRKTLL